MSRTRERLAIVAAGVAAAAGAALFLAGSAFAGGPFEIGYALVEAATPIAWWVVGATIVTRAGYDAQRTAIDFAAGLRDQVDLSTISDEIADVVATALRPSTIGVWLREPAPSQSRRGTP